MALPSIMLLLAFVGGVFAAAGFALVLAVGERRSRQRASARRAAHRRRPRRDRRRRRLAPLAALPGADHRRRRRRRGGGDRRRPARRRARRHAERSRTSILGFVLLLGIGVFLFAMRWDSSDPARATRRSRRRLLASPAGGADDRPPDLHSARAERRRRRRIGEGLVVIAALCRARPDRAGDRPARAARLGARLCALRAEQLFKQFGAVELNIALTALVIGSALLLLSAFWHQARVDGGPAAAGRPPDASCPTSTG